jgi:A/G-specific adenine glycosylase
VPRVRPAPHIDSARGSAGPTRMNARRSEERSGNASAESREFSRSLLLWYDRHKRDLPWRENRDPYRVWLSEIMLQQTRVAAVLEHYRRFLRKFPDVRKLAAAREASVLAAWSGLGYYRRARMLHAAAKEIVREHQGEFPAKAQQLRDLPGIGRYTAAAIASIAFGEAAAVVDGNVERVLSRLRGKPLRGEVLWDEAERRLSRDRPGEFNQAMMELGATVCVPGPPQCLFCPVREFCSTRGELARQKRAPAQKRRTIHYSLGRRNGRVFLIQRPKGASLMPGMWELPEWTASVQAGKAFLHLRHSITVTDYDVRVIESPPAAGVGGEWIPRERLSSLALTGLARKILRRAGLI